MATLVPAMIRCDPYANDFLTSDPPQSPFRFLHRRRICSVPGGGDGIGDLCALRHYCVHPAFLIEEDE
jgi:hypothetical protein